MLKRWEGRFRKGDKRLHKERKADADRMGRRTTKKYEIQEAPLELLMCFQMKPGVLILQKVKYPNLLNCNSYLLL